MTNSQRELKLMRWGLIPSWIKDIKTTKPLINARSETVHQKPSFRDSFHASRCLIPVDGFLEWKTEGVKKISIFYFSKSKRYFFFCWYLDKEL